MEAQLRTRQRDQEALFERRMARRPAHAQYRNTCFQTVYDQAEFRRLEAWCASQHTWWNDELIAMDQEQVRLNGLQTRHQDALWRRARAREELYKVRVRARITILLRACSCPTGSTHEALETEVMCLARCWDGAP